MTNTLRVSMLLALAMLLSGACQPAGDADAGADAGEQAVDLLHLAEHVCTHFQTGTPHAVTASASRDPGADEVQIEHDVFAAGLVAFEGDQGGYLRVVPSAAGHIAFFFNKDLPVAVEDDGGATLTVHEQLLQPSTCASIQKIAVYELEAASYYLKLGPSSETAVDIVAEEAAHEHG
ncbi:MAG: hypothetical protein ABIJ09_27375 [Pseudomonadota bacterium]